MINDPSEAWEVVEKHRANSSSKHADKYYKKEGDSKTYRSLAEVARAYYPQFLTDTDSTRPPKKKRR